MEQEKLLNELASDIINNSELVFDDAGVQVFTTSFDVKPGDVVQSKAAIYRLYTTTTENPLPRPFFFAELSKYFRMERAAIYLNKRLKKPPVYGPTKRDKEIAREKRLFARFMQETSLQPGTNMVLLKDIYTLYLIWHRTTGVKKRIKFQVLAEHLKTIIPATKVRKLSCFMLNLNIPEMLKQFNDQKQTIQTEVSQS